MLSPGSLVPALRANKDNDTSLSRVQFVLFIILLYYIVVVVSIVVVFHCTETLVS